MNAHRRALAMLWLGTLLTLLTVEACTCGPSPTPTVPPTSTSTPSATSSSSSLPASSSPQGSDSGAPSVASDGTVVRVVNETAKQTTVYVAFGADSAVTGWPFCTSTGRLNCTFGLDQSGGARELPLGGKYLNATFSFDAPPGCGSTKAELNVNNPNWYNIADVSLVDGFSNFVAIDVLDTSGGKTLGPPNGPKGNEKLFGVYPLGCDTCVARQSPPCGIPKGTDGCKAGTQFAPIPPCQWQGSQKGGGGGVTVRLLAGIPAK